ncbi:hypothetical protein CC79DRAFT_482995 [Sarocladium strictum]
MAPWSRWAAPVFKNTGSVARDHLASERTYLAWTRTGLGFVALGIAVERFSRFEMMESARGDRTLVTAKGKEESRQEQLSRRILVGTLMTLGTGSVIYATRRYFTVLRRLEQGKFPPAYHGVAAMGAVMGALTGGIFAGTARGWRDESQASK